MVAFSLSANSTYCCAKLSFFVELSSIKSFLYTYLTFFIQLSLVLNRFIFASHLFRDRMM